MILCCSDGANKLFTFLFTFLYQNALLLTIQKNENYLLGRSVKSSRSPFYCVVYTFPKNHDYILPALIQMEIIILNNHKHSIFLRKALVMGDLFTNHSYSNF